MRRLSFKIFSITAAFLILVVSNGCKKGATGFRLSGETDYNLLIITLDTTRADRVGVYGYPKAETPNIDSLAQNGVVLKNCYASVPLTLPSHVTLFTGREPIAHQVRNNGTYILKQEETTLAEMMQGRAYHTFAVIASFTLHSKFGLSQGFDDYNDSLDFNTAANNIRTEIDAGKVYAKFKSWFKKNHDEKFFSWVHFYDPHSPYDPPPEYKSRFSEDYYDGEIAYMDRFIGKIIEDLKSEEVLHKTLIVVAGDHGEAFGEHKEYGHGIFCYEESLKVPLIFSNPVVFKDENRVISHRICLTDIMPTVLDLFEIDNPGNMHGKSLSSLLFGKKESQEAQIYIESLFGKEDMGWAPLTGMIFQDYKYISLPTPELYDLTNDPKEEQNLFNKKKSMAKKFDGELRKYIQIHSESGATARRTLTDTDRKKLESLGYASPFSEKAQRSIDPKDGIDLLNEVLSVKKLLDEGKAEEAEGKLLDLQESDQGIRLPPFYDNLCNMYRERGEIDKAISVLEKAVKMFPDKKRFQVNLALFYLEAGKIHEAETLSLSLIEEYPDIAQAYSLLALIYKGKGEIDKAVTFYERAKEIEPLNVMLQLNHAEAELERGNSLKAVEIVDLLMQNEVLMNETESAKVRIRMGVLLARGGEYDRAIEVFLKIIENKNANTDVWTHMGLSYYNKGDLQKAEDSYNRALEIDEKNALALSSLGTLYLALFRAEKRREFHSRAIDFYEKAIDVDPHIASAYNGLAVAYRFENKNQMAVSLWKKTINVKPDFTNAYINLGITLITMGRKKEALEYLNLCKEKYFSRLSGDDQRQLLELIAEAKS